MWSLFLICTTLFIILILGHTFWNLTKFMISLSLKMIFGILGIPYRYLMNKTTWGRLDREPSPYIDDDTSIWVEGNNGRYFRYDLALDGKALDNQMDNLQSFYRTHKG